MRRKDTDPVEGPNLDEHPEIETEEEEDEKPRRRAPRKRVDHVDEPRDPSNDDKAATPSNIWMPGDETPDPPPKPEADWADKTDRGVTSKPDDVP